MKKILKMFLILSLISPMFLTGCAKIGEIIEKYMNYNVTTNTDLTLLSNYEIEENSEEEKYKIVESFSFGDGKHYYLYYLGQVTAIPIDISSCDGLYYEGGNQTLTFRKTTSVSSSVTEGIAQITNASISNSSSAHVNASIGGAAGAVVGKLEAGVSVSQSSSVSATQSTTIQKALKTETTFVQELELSFKDKIDKVGYYCYATVASMKLYEIVVYNPNTQQIEMAVPYSILGNAFKGLVYSEDSFFDYDVEPIEFDVNKISFPIPETDFSSNITIDFNSNGGSCDITSKEFMLGEKFGELPTATPSVHGYYFDGWYQNGNKITSESFVASLNELVAVYKLKTEFTITISDSFQLLFQTSQIFKGYDEQIINSTISANIEELRKENYKATIIVEYYVYKTNKISAAEYDLLIGFADKENYKYSDRIGRTDVETKKRTVTTTQISAQDFEGRITLKFRSDNIAGINFTNLKITVKFTK